MLEFVAFGDFYFFLHNIVILCLVAVIEINGLAAPFISVSVIVSAPVIGYAYGVPAVFAYRIERIGIDGKSERQQSRRVNRDLQNTLSQKKSLIYRKTKTGQFCTLPPHTLYPNAVNRHFLFPILN